MQLHAGMAGEAACQALPTWVALDKSMPLVCVEHTLWSANFGQLRPYDGRHAAGYYGCT